MRPSRVLEKLRRGRKALGVTLHLTDPSLFEMAGLMGFDAVWMDMEHHFYSLETASHAMRAARVGGMDVVARPAKGEFAQLSRMLEAGANGIMYPRCDNAAEAAEVVRWAKFAPLGRRGLDGSNPDVPYMMTPLTDYISQANEQTFVIIQLEDAGAVAQADAIAAVPGVDMLMLGPADYSVLSGIPFQFDHPDVHAAFDTVSRAAAAAGKHWASTSGSIEHAQHLFEKGASLVFNGCDIVLVKQGLEQIRGAFESELERDVDADRNTPAAYEGLRT